MGCTLAIIFYYQSVKAWQSTGFDQESSPEEACLLQLRQAGQLPCAAPPHTQALCSAVTVHVFESLSDKFISVCGPLARPAFSLNTQFAE